jgi:hypothetical protein
MTYRFHITAIALVVTGMMVPRAAGQDTQSGAQQPLPPIAQPGTTSTAPAAKPAATGTPVTEGDVDVPDTRPLAGAQELTLGSTTSGHNLLLPSFGVATQVRTNPYVSGQTDSPSVVSTTFLTGRLGLNYTSGHSELSLNYLAGGSFSNDSVGGDSGIQSLGFSETIRSGRWSQMIGDQLTYTSQTPFGFGGLGSLNNLGVNPGSGLGSDPGFRSGFLPDQSVLINGTTQLNNSVIAQTDYQLSHRASLTFVGSYGILDFPNDNLQNDSNETFQAGYNYLLDRKNSVSVFYRFERFGFSNLAQSTEINGAQVSYARRITGMLSLQIGGGPQADIFRSPLTGPGTVADWSFSTTLNYRHKNSIMNVGFDRSITGGSGILAGAQTKEIHGTFTQKIGQNWSAMASGGYAKNSALQQTTPNANTIAPETWFVTAQVSRRFVGYSSLFMSYSAIGQTSLASVCTLPVCRVNSASNTVSIGYNWGLRGIALE